MYSILHRSLSTLFFAASALLTFGQIEYGGEPLQWSEKSLNLFGDVAFYRTDALDMESIQAADAVTDPMKDVPYRFGWEWEVNLSTENSGTWTDLPNGGRVWQLGIDCPDASSISFIFDRYELPKGAKLFIWDAERSTYKGAFTHKNNKEWGSLGVGLIHSDQVVIELIESPIAVGQSELQLGTIVHGYRPVARPSDQEAYDRGPFGNSGNCNINVNCPEGEDWAIESRSVALIVSGGFAQCSGALVNNTLQDGTPYFLTANHCLGGQNNWVFYFNHETAGCSGSTGPTNQSISGSSLRASNGGSDFALLELSSTPPADFNVQYAGWDNSDALNVTSAVGIHHPSGDVKKICFEDDAPFHQNVFGAACWYINQWEDGVTEGGSSGSPLFDQNHRIIGQLYGGGAACAGSVNNGEPDWYGRFGVSWDGNSATTRLRDWLDPSDSGVAFLDGYPDGFEPVALDATIIGGVQNVESTVCGSSITPIITLLNNGLNTLTSVAIEQYLNGSLQGTYNWTGSLAQGESEVVVLSTINVSEGDNTLTIALTNPNNGVDENPGNNETEIEFSAVAGPTLDITLEIVLDDYGSETTWDFRNDANEVLYSGGPYQDNADGTLVEVDFCVPDGCYTFNIYDEWGDGICCEYGQGSYTIFNWNGQNIGSGGEFTESDSFTFCTDDVSVSEAEATGISLYPNPTNELLTVELPEASRELSIFDARGQLVFQIDTKGQTTMRIPTTELANGWYTLSVSGAGFRSTERLVIIH